MQRIKYLTIITSMMMCFSALIAQNTSKKEREYAFERGVELFEKNKYAASQKAFKLFLQDKEATTNDKYISEAYYYDAVAAQLLNNNDAEYKLNEFIRNFPQSSRISMACFYLANLHYADKNYAEALKQYRKVEPSQIDNSLQSEYEFKFGYSLFQGGNQKKAKEYFSRVMTTESRYANSALYYYAHIQYDGGEYELALNKFLKLMDDKKFAGIVPYYVAQIYFYLDKDDEFLELSPSLIEKSNDSRKAEIQQMTGEVYYKQGSYCKALEYYEQANHIIPQKNDYQIGYCYYQLEEYQKATPYFERYAMVEDSIAQNALYHLADVYLKLGNKVKAQAMFLQVSKMDYDPKLKEEALYNHAKLSCEIGNNPYNESIKSFQNYLKLYPKTPRKNEINEILTSLYFSTRNYKSAISLIESLPERTMKIDDAYQRILLNRGIELYNEHKYDKAISMFKKATKTGTDKNVMAQAYYMLGETNYQITNFDEAKANYQNFLTIGETESVAYKNALYTMGYVYLKEKEYGKSRQMFFDYIKHANYIEDKKFIDDATNRIADNFFVQKSFKDAVVYYDKVISADAINADYAMYQKGLCYGALCRYQDKIDCLNLLMSKYPNSKYVMTSNFEIANTLLLNDDEEMALKFYNVFVMKYPKSSYTKEALLKIGIINFNLNNEDEALVSLDKVLKNYPGTAEARDALLTIKNIYINQNRVDEYFTYVKQNTKMSISTVEQDSLTFYAAETRYMEADCQTAIPAFEKYLKDFPNGLFTLTANYYLADCQLRSGSMWKALPYYEYVANQPKSQYTEVALLNVANIAFNIKNYTKSNEYFTKLAETSEIESNVMQAGVGVMRTWYLLENYSNAIQSAVNLLQSNKLTTDIKEEAQYTVAISYYNMGDTASSRQAFELLKQSANGAYVGEAYYREAEACFARGDMKGAEQVILTITVTPVSDYWLAKSFILWADIYYKAGNKLQAKQTLQSIIENYDGEDLVAEAQTKYDNMINEENKAREIREKQLQEMQEKDNEIDMTSSENDEKSAK